MKKIYCFYIGLLCVLICIFGALFYRLKNQREVAILYLATGRYIVFWDEFYSSMEKNFLPDHQKHYFIFTDNQTIHFPDNVTKIKIPNLKFPEISLRRWELFSKISNTLRQFKYIYFLNGNAEVIRPVHEEIFPTPEQGIMVAWHPGYYKHRDINQFPYDRNEKSTAYIPYGQGKFYVQGGFNGGLSEAFLQMVETCLNNTQTDQKNGVVALWHDESHLNKYIIDKTPLVMDGRYIWAPFDWNYYDEIKNDIRIIMRNKNNSKYGGFNWLRGYTDIKAGEENISLDDKKTGYLLDHPQWSSWLIKKNDVFCRVDVAQECAKIKKISNHEIIVYWQQWNPEHFIFSKEKEMWIFKPD